MYNYVPLITFKLHSYIWAVCCKTILISLTHCFFYQPLVFCYFSFSPTSFNYTINNINSYYCIQYQQVNMQSYILTYYRLRKKELLIALWAPTRALFNFCIHGTPPEGRVNRNMVK